MWRNWLGNQRSTPSSLARPRGIEEVRAALGEARRRGLTVRAVGTGHAMAPLVPTTGMLVSMERCDRLLSVDGDVIEVEAGMDLRGLVAHAARHGLAVMGSAIYRDISVGGLTATGSHGTGLAGGCFSDRVIE
jgi:L-gulonolactone oxidase